MTPHVVDCGDCAYGETFDDFERATDALEDHSQSEVGHAVTLTRARAVADGGATEEDLRDAVTEFFENDADVESVEYSPERDSGIVVANVEEVDAGFGASETFDLNDFEEVLNDHGFEHTGYLPAPEMTQVNVESASESEEALVTDGGSSDCGRRTCDRSSAVTYTNKRGAVRTRCDVHALADAVDGVGEVGAEKILDEIGLEQLVDRCEGADGVTAPVVLSRIDGLGPTTAKTIAENVDNSPIPDALEPKETITDGGRTREYYLLDSLAEPSAVVAGPFDDEFDALEEREHRVGEGDPAMSIGLWTGDALDQLSDADGWDLEWEIEDVPEWAQDEPRVATDGGQLTRGQQKQARRLQLRHGAAQAREQRLAQAVELGEPGRNGQRVWIIPEFQPTEEERKYITESVRNALPEYNCKQIVDSTAPMTKERIYGLLGVGDDEEDEQEVATDGGGHVCDACGEPFETLTRLRLHETDDCIARETYAEIDPGSGDVGEQGATELLTCRNCDRENPNADDDVRTSFADGDFHYIVEFACAGCGFENENRLVMTGVDRSDLENLPPHLQPDDEEIATDGGRTVLEGDRVRVRDDSPSPHAGEAGEVVAVDAPRSCIVEGDGWRCRHADAELDLAQEVALDGGFAEGDRVRIVEDSESPKAGWYGHVYEVHGDHVIVDFDDGDRIGHPVEDVVLAPRASADGGTPFGVTDD